MFWKVVRLLENPNKDGYYCPISLAIPLYYKPGQRFEYNPAWQGPYTAFSSYKEAKNFALEHCEFAIFECDGEITSDQTLRWDTTSGYHFVNQGLGWPLQKTWPEGIVFLKWFCLGKKVAEMVNGHFAELA
jgi:hypothetical protein